MSTSPKFRYSWRAICALVISLGWFGPQAHSQSAMPALGDRPSSGGLVKESRTPPPYALLAKAQSIPEIKQPVYGVQKAVVILVDFPDYTWTTQHDSNFVNPVDEPGFEGLFGQGYFTEMLFSLQSFADPFGSSSYSGSMRDYFRETSYGLVDLEGSVVGWYTAEKPYRAYANGDQMPGTPDDHGFGGGPDNVRTFVQEAVRLADPDIDFAEFDQNGDGFVDALFIVHAGPGAEELFTRKPNDHYNYFWSHQSSMSLQTEDGVSVGTYTVEPENGTIGVFCHEYGHVLGLPDLYDVDRSSEGIGEWGLMAGGGWCFVTGDRVGTSPAHLSAWSKIKLGWLQPVDINQGSSIWQLPPVETNPVAIRVWNPVLSQSNSDPSEYFLLENRQNISFDRGLTRRQVELDKPKAYGLVIYHIDETVGNNSNESRKRVDVEEATPVLFEGFWIENLDLTRNLGGYEFLFNGNRGDNGDAFPGFLDFNEARTDFVGLRIKDEFSDSTLPSSRSNQDEATQIAITNIQLDGETVSFSVETDQTVTGIAGGAHNQTAGLPPLGFAIVPNPVRESAQFELTTGVDRPGQLLFYNLLGQEIHSMAVPARQNRIIWDGMDSKGQVLQSGLYVIVLRVGSEIETQKMVILK